jgi:hypothetical protein
MQRSDDGALRIVGVAADLVGATSGTWTVALAVGRSEDLPTVARALSAPSTERPWQLLATSLRFADGS